MWIIGCDFHPRYHQIAALNRDTDELVEPRLSHEGKEAAAFYEALPRGALIGMEATCTAQWFERLLERCGHTLRVGDAAQIRASVVRKQKTDTRDALHVLDLLLTDRFPSVWIPTPAERDARQLLLHRHTLVRWRTAVQNQLHALAAGRSCLRRGAQGPGIETDLPALGVSSRQKDAAVAVARKLALKLYWRLREVQEQRTAPPAPMQGCPGSGLVKAVSSPSV